MRARLVVALMVCLALAGCGGGESEAERVESVLRAYVERYKASQPQEMYALLDSQSRALCSEERFVAFTSAAREALGEREFAIVEIRDVLVEGDEASATVLTSVGGELADPTENSLVNEDGTWKLVLPSIGC